VPQFSLSAKVAASFSLPKRKSTYGNASIRVFLKGGTYTHITARSTQHAWRHARHVSKRLPLELYVSVARAQVNSTSTVYMDVADQQGQRAPHGTLSSVSRILLLAVCLYCKSYFACCTMPVGVEPGQHVHQLPVHLMLHLPFTLLRILPCCPLLHQPYCTHTRTCTQLRNVTTLDGRWIGWTHCLCQHTCMMNGADRFMQ
jgi:hypothetical protein